MIRMRIPRPMSLVSQTAQAIREEAERGRWRETLPGERPLAQELQVSRVTLRAALALLRRQGAIVTEGRRHRLRRAPRSVRRRGAAEAVVAYLHLGPVHLLPQFKLFEMGELRRLLGQAGLSLRVIEGAGVAGLTQPARLLHRLVRDVRAECWVLSSCPAPVQRWFAGQRLPAAVSGTCHAGVDLPSVDFDHAAIARHAAGLLLGRGHRRIALLVPDTGAAGDIGTAQGFRDAFGAPGTPATQPVVLRHNRTVPAIRRTLDSGLRMAPPPTALLVSHAQHVLTALTHVLTRGLCVPRDMALISLQNDTDLAYLVPSVASYETNMGLYVRRLARIVVQLAASGAAQTRHWRLLGELRPGASLPD
jgi:DNA-binding LacI/PurR family transcriptional regulator/DNA-binding transcriptional regulator YhcF (GntR family)